MQTLQQLQSGQLKGYTQVKISCGLTALPDELFSLADTLEILDLSGNKLRELPGNFNQLSKLKILFLSDNDFTVFPEVLGSCPLLEMIGFKANKIHTMSETCLPPNTRWLILTNNQLETLPKAIGKCASMQKLMLAGNRLKELPTELAQCKNLGLLRISANRLKVLPEWLFSMPNLSWLALAGNPFSNISNKENSKLPIIQWHELMTSGQLGQGASGIIWKADWNNGKEKKTVAVKIFKGEVTSDGLPDDEMAACMLAGSHPNIVQVLGKINGHPENKKGLVLSLIPSNYKNLGGTPSFKTCTRDVFDEGTGFTLNQILSIASGIASSLSHLHSKGILHGDLYAHNILIDPNAHALFGDFGAASIYDKGNLIATAALERIEVSAFGCLLEDLLTYTIIEKEKDVILAKLTQLKNDCLRKEIMKRPNFERACKLLNALLPMGLTPIL